MVADTLDSMIFTTCWEHSVLVDIENKELFTGSHAMSELRRLVERRMRGRSTNPYKRQMSMFQLISHCMESAMVMFSGNPNAATEVPHLVGAFMWTAINGRPPWDGFARVLA
jgi:hypothetical protein